MLLTPGPPIRKSRRGLFLTEVMVDRRFSATPKFTRILVRRKKTVEQLIFFIAKITLYIEYTESIKKV
jgi:hypothetical protein